MIAESVVGSATMGESSVLYVGPFGPFFLILLSSVAFSFGA